MTGKDESSRKPKPGPSDAEASANNAELTAPSAEFSASNQELQPPGIRVFPVDGNATTSTGGYTRPLRLDIPAGLNIFERPVSSAHSLPGDVDSLAIPAAAKKPRGRPRKVVPPEDLDASSINSEMEAVRCKGRKIQASTSHYGTGLSHIVPQGASNLAPSSAPQEGNAATSRGQAFSQNAHDAPRAPSYPNSRDNEERVARNNYGSNRRRIPVNPDFEFSEEEDLGNPRGASRPITPIALLNIMKKWGIKFSGYPHEDVELLLSRIDEGLAFLSIRETDLLSALPFVLDGPALIWYRGHAREFHSWTNAREAFRSHFADPDYQMALRDEVSRRTQAEGESARNYFACLRGYFARLRPTMADWEQVKLTHRNMLPVYRINFPLRDGLSMDEMEMGVLRIERIYQGSADRRPPPRPEESVCPSLAYRAPRAPARPPYRAANRSALRAVQCEEEYEETSDQIDQQLEEDFEEVTLDAASVNRKPTFQSKRTQHSRVTAPNPATSLAWQASLKPRASRPRDNNTTAKQAVAPRSQPSGSTAPKAKTTPVSSATVAPPAPVPTQATPAFPQNLECWNCNEKGHRHRDCPQPKRLFCHRCRYSGVTVRNCPSCSKGNEN